MTRRLHVAVVGYGSGGQAAALVGTANGRDVAGRAHAGRNHARLTVTPSRSVGGADVRRYWAMPRMR